MPRPDDVAGGVPQVPAGRREAVHWPCSGPSRTTPPCAWSAGPTPIETVLSGLGDTHLEVTVVPPGRALRGARWTPPSPASPTGRRSAATPTSRASTRSRPAAAASSAWPSSGSSPCPPGAATSSSTRSRAATIPRQYIPAVDKGIQEALERGILAGYPVVDIRATLYDGKHHAVDSDELSFRMAGILAVKAATPKLNADPARADHEGRPSGCRRTRWARSSATSTPAGAGCSAWTPTASTRVDHRRGAPGRDAALPHRPSLDHQRPRLLRDGDEPLRGGPPNETQKVIAAARAED